MTRAALLLASLALIVSSCDGNSTGPATLDGTYTLVAENDVPLPSDHGEPAGCCLTLGGSLTLTAGTYDLRTSHRNKNNGIAFDDSEQGTYARQGNTLTFLRTGGGGEGFPYLLGAGTVSADNSTVTLLYGDEGPGSNQIRATFVRGRGLVYSGSPMRSRFPCVTSPHCSSPGSSRPVRLRPAPFSI